MKIAWVVSEDVSYLNFLGRYIEDRGFLPKKFFHSDDCMTSLLTEEAPDLIIIADFSTHEKIDENVIEQITRINSSQSVITLSTIQLMALVQFELSHDHNELGLKTENQSMIRLTKAVKLIEALNL